MPQGAKPEPEREGGEAECKALERQFEREGRYPGREREVAARIVNQRRAEAGDTEPGTTSAQRPGRGGTGHRRRNTARRNKSS